MGRGYSGNHPRYSKHGDERYDAKEAYNKDLTASARLHYLENDRHDHESPAKMDPMTLMKIASMAKSMKNDSPTDRHCSPMNNKADRLRGRARKRSERLGTESNDYAYEDPKVQKYLRKANAADERSNNEYESEQRQQELNSMMDERSDINRYSSSPANACAKSEGGDGCVKEMGGAWRVISNKTDKPWPAKYASKAKADAALRGYHAG